MAKAIVRNAPKELNTKVQSSTKEDGGRTKQEELRVAPQEQVTNTILVKEVKELIEENGSIGPGPGPIPGNVLTTDDVSSSYTTDSSKIYNTTFVNGVKTTADSALQPTDIVDNVTSIATDKVLSAKQGKLLNDRLDNISNIGRFLALWDCTTGLPLTNPGSLPYTYHTGDYYRINAVGETNYFPTGSQYTGAASTEVYTGDIGADDVVFYDGTTWKLQRSGAGGTVQDVQVNGTSVVSSGVANIQKASDSALGVVRTNSSTYGIAVNADGKLYIVAPTDADIVSKSSSTKPITCSKLDKAVMEGLGNNSLTWSDTYKANARNTIGAGVSVDIEVL